MRFVARRVADPHVVADLTAEVFLAVLDSVRAYRPSEGSPVAWLYGIARNVIAQERRRATYQRQVAGRIAGRRLLDSDDITRLEDRIDAERACRGPSDVASTNGNRRRGPQPVDFDRLGEPGSLAPLVLPPIPAFTSRRRRRPRTGGSTPRVNRLP
jgi:hypothetical protein